MLSRTKTMYISLFSATVLLLGANCIIPVQGFTRTPPKVSVQNIVANRNDVSRADHKFVFTLTHIAKSSPFGLVGVTWRGSLSSDAVIEVKVRENSQWSTWQQLTYSPDHGPSATSSEFKKSRSGTDPLITGMSTGVQVRLITAHRKLPKDIEVSLIASASWANDIQVVRSARASVTMQARRGSVITKTGALVNRPNIVSRSEWGADESWRDPSPRVSKKLIAGFIHHTATTNSYNPADGPAQMRDLYAYFTKSLKYSDMGYNFLVDRYGVIYEGRAGCALSNPGNCDGPSLPVIGAHTAGMNENTFAISAIGNFQTTPISKDTATSLVNSISALMAWKIAPYNLDPNAIAHIPSTDTSGLSQYQNGQTANVSVISGHRDVGRTVCPGKYLYAYVPTIRNQIAALLVGNIENFTVTPVAQLATNVQPVTISAKVPVTSNWNITISDANTGDVVSAVTTKQTVDAPINYQWMHTDSAGQLLPAGNYAISISATVQERQFPVQTTMVLLGQTPAAITGGKMQQTSNFSALLTWPIQSESIPLVDAIYYRTSLNKGSTWSAWQQVPDGSTQQSFRTSLPSRKILIEVKQVNAMGESPAVQFSYKSKS